MCRAAYRMGSVRWRCCGARVRDVGCVSYYHEVDSLLCVYYVWHGGHAFYDVEGCVACVTYGFFMV